MKLKIFSIVLFLMAVLTINTYAEDSALKSCRDTYGNNDLQVVYCMENNLLVNKEAKVPIRPWIIGTFLDCDGTISSRDYTYMCSVGSFLYTDETDELNTDICYADVLLFKCTNNDMGIFVYKLSKENKPVSELKPGAYLKAQNESGETIVVLFEELLKWNEDEGILISNNAPLRSLLFKSPGLVSFELYDGYDATYEFAIDADDLTRTYNNM